MEKYIPNFDLAAISKFNFNFGPSGLFAILGLIFLLLYGLSLGRTRALVSLLGIYIAYAVMSVFPYLDRLHDLIRASPELYITRVGLFLFIYVIVFAVLNNSLVKSRLTIKDASFLSVSIISIMQLGLLITIITNIVPVSVLKISGSLAYLSEYFSTNEALFYWFLAPIVIVAFMKRGKKHRSSED
ncbi:MAG: hypothetical protein HYT64_02095 [Candidatus Yanofskybacteria bacterium]|nr:hypothetical protein [Candidatus Yanofskybacteria bacterium]